MGLSELAKEMGGGPLALVASGLFLAVSALFYLLIASKNARIERAEKRADELETELAESKNRHLAMAIEVAPLAGGMLRLHDDLRVRLERVDQERLEQEVLRAELEKERDELKRLRRLPRVKAEGGGT